MSLKMYTAVSVAFLNAPFFLQEMIPAKHLHVTMSFQDVEEFKHSIYADQLTGPIPESSLVTSLEYWEHNDITVAILYAPDWSEARECFDRCGLTYQQYAFKPHVTLGKGDLRNLLGSLVGYRAVSLDTYFRIKDFGR